MYYDLLAKIKNAEQSQKNVVYTPFSKMDFAVLKTLAESRYIKEVQKKSVSGHPCLEVVLQKDSRRYALNDFRILSKPSRRFYVGYRALRPVKQGYGIGILSTPRGIMSHKEAKKQKLGGEYLFEVW